MGSVQPMARHSTMMEAKAVMYEVAFESSGNQVQLTADHIVANVDVDKDVEQRSSDHDDDTSEYLVLDRRTQTKDEATNLDVSLRSTNTSRKSQRRSSIVHPVTNAVVRGSSALCVDDFQVDDMVVWSETNVYHKA